VVTGDTDQFYWGAGTFASRGAVVAGNAVSEAAKVVRRKILRIASEHFECAEEDLEIGAGSVSIAGVPGRSVRLGELAMKANPMRGAVKPGTEPGLESTQYFGPPTGATASGVHAMVIEVDPETFAVAIRKYVMVHDCGTVINPMILAGQIHGGIAQGIGNAFYEHLALSAAGGARRTQHGTRPQGDAFAPQPAGDQGCRRGWRHPGRRAICAGGRGRARPGRQWCRDSRNAAEPQPALATGELLDGWAESPG
jgi:CO/xanthine dehydrogenase Mo-binding subunit